MMKDLLQKANAARSAIRNGEYEITDEGIYIPASGILAGGVMESWVNDGDQYSKDHNIVPLQGLDYLIGSSILGTTPITSWYLAPFEGNVTPAAGWTAANFVATATEFQDYDEAARQAWAAVDSGSQSVDNVAAPAAITCNADNSDVYGAAITSISGKGAVTGTLLAAVRFTNAPKAIDNTDVLNLRYTFAVATV